MFHKDKKKEGKKFYLNGNEAYGSYLIAQQRAALNALTLFSPTLKLRIQRNLEHCKKLPKTRQL